MNNEVAFKLDGYKFTKAILNFDIPQKAELDINFKPSGKFYEKDGCYKLFFDTAVIYKETDTVVISISCIASFSFNGKIRFNDIPEFFYPHSLVIIVPYIGAFVSTLSLQANTSPIVLPTVNLMGLTDILCKNTSVVK